jgi:hypothetical protein
VGGLPHIARHGGSRVGDFRRKRAEKKSIILEGRRGVKKTVKMASQLIITTTSTKPVSKVSS